MAGIDAYPDPGDTSMLKERIRYLAGSSKLPFVPEFGSGSWFDREQLLSPKEERFGYLYAFMNGMKAVNFICLLTVTVGLVARFEMMALSGRNGTKCFWIC